MKFSLDSILPDDDPNPDDYEVWDNPKGAHIVREYQRDGVKYVEAEFKNSPGEIYTYVRK